MGDCTTNGEMSDQDCDGKADFGRAVMTTEGNLRMPWVGACDAPAVAFQHLSPLLAREHPNDGVRQDFQQVCT